MIVRRMIHLLPLGLLLTACASGTETTSSTTTTSSQRQADSFKPADTSGQSNPAFADGYIALKDGDINTATQDLQVAYTKAPNDPYEALDLGAAYQNGGFVDKAMPLYVQTENRGTGVMPADVTDPAVRGMTLDEIARHNMALAGYDASGTRIRTSSVATTTVVQAPAPAAAEPPKKVFQVFFDFDKSTITPEGATIIRLAVANAQANNPIRIVVTGHTDTVGTDTYNQALSERRAAAVMRVLVSSGVPADEIVTRGVGKAGELVPTGDGVREPQNRRVEIVEGQYVGS